jgi:hypothetical protein
VSRLVLDSFGALCSKPSVTSRDVGTKNLVFDKKKTKFALKIQDFVRKKIISRLVLDGFVTFSSNHKPKREKKNVKILSGKKIA